MSWILILLLIFLGIAVLIVIARIIIKWITLEESLLEQAKGALSYLGSCCKKWFGGA